MGAQQVDQSIPDVYHSRPAVSTADVEEAIDFVVERTGSNLPRFTDSFPAGSSEDGRYERTDGMYLWTPSFWTGMLWLASDVTDEERFRSAAASHRDHYRKRLVEGRTNHDLGFLYSLSAVAEYKLTGNPAARALGVQAADALADRFLENPGIIQAWGDTEDPDDEWEHGRMIVDTMMNLPLLFWASETTGHDAYHDVAVEHARQSASYLLRDDDSLFHTFKMDVETGDPIGGETHQGHADDSAWARGQAWGVYGFPLVYRYTGDEQFRRIATRVADYYLDHLPADHVPYWDLDLGGPDVDRDSSAAAIAACGLLELSAQLPAADERRQYYENAALATIESLAEGYTTGPDADGVLDHGVHNHPGGDGIDECCLWGDYFYFESLVRAARNAEPFW